MVSCEINHMQSYLILKCVPSHRIQRSELRGRDVLLFFQESFSVMRKLELTMRIITQNVHL